MASEKLEKILAMSKNIDKKGNKKTSQVSRKPMGNPISIVEQIKNADKAISNIDAAYNAPYVPTQEEAATWNTERGREELTEMANRDIFLEKLNNSKLPTAILESMRNNPCNYDVETVNGLMGPENELFKRLNEVYGKDKEENVSGVKAIQKINEQLANRDKQSINEVVENVESKNIVETNIDYDMIEQIIERVIDRKLGMLNESKGFGGSPIKTMSLTANGNFRFLDSEDNVYECQMKYLGKRKRKK